MHIVNQKIIRQSRIPFGKKTFFFKCGRPKRNNFLFILFAKKFFKVNVLDFSL